MLRRIIQILSLIGLGALLPLAFAPFNFWPIAIITPALLLIFWQNAANARQSFIQGLLFGIGMFGTGVSWVYVSIHQFGNTEKYIAAFITALLVGFLSLFIALQGYVLKRFFKGNNISVWFLGFPSLWVIFEWIRSWLFTGFPWLFLGYSQLNSPLSGYAPLASVYIVSLSVTFSAGCLAAFFKGTKPIRYFSLGFLIFLWSGGAILQNLEWTKPIGKALNVSLVQGNIDPLNKFAAKDPILATEAVYGNLTKALWGRHLILWPESAIPVPIPYSNDYLEKLHAIAKAHGSTLITGIQTLNENKEYYNSLIALGLGKGIYHKQHLLPYGDYLPFERYLRGLINFFDLPMSNFIPGPKNQALIQTEHLRISPVICYEIAFPELLRESLRNANAIITLSEDGWFGTSWGPHQHLEIARMRALETGRWLLRATACGLTAIINPQGKIQNIIPQFQAMVLEGTFIGMTGSTPWMFIGPWPLLLILFLFFIIPGRFKSKLPTP